MEDSRRRLKEIAPCLHVRNPQIQQFYLDHHLPDFTKRACKHIVKEELVPVHVSSTRCDLCAAYGSLSLRLPTGRDKGARFTAGPRMELLNGNEFNRRKDEIQRKTVDFPKHLIAMWLNPFRPWMKLKGYFRFPDTVPESIRLKVAPKQFGEMYHILVCAILNAPDSNPETDSEILPRVLINLTDATHEQRELFEFYAGVFPKKTIVYKKWEEPTDAKSEATQSIYAYFWKSELFDVQEKLFRTIRKFMCKPSFCLGHGDKYVSTDYSAKYWVNRFLLLSDQGKLPKLDSNVSRIAVINIRRPSTDEAPDQALQPRAEMTSQNLKSTIQAILAANIAAMQSGSPSLVFTHVILYGDFNTLQEAIDVITYTNNIAEQSKVSAPKILYISAPWRTLKVESWTPSPIRKLTAQINNLWANFRGDEASFLGGAVDSIPMQVKVINIYTALKLRYANQLCVIGFRSGFLEAAGFLGIPIFYMNETNIDKRPDLNFDDGRMLWHGPYAEKIENRLGNCSNHITTFIAVDIPGPKQSVKPNSQGKKQLTILVPKVVATGQRDLSKQNVELNSQGKKQLMAALYMYMLSEDSYGKLLWQRRREMMNSKPPTPTEIPSSSAASTHHTSASVPSTSTHTVADEALGEGQVILKRRYEECKALWTVSGLSTDKSSPRYRVRALVD